MVDVIKKDTLGVYIGGFKEIKNLQGRAMEDTPKSEGYIWMDFGNKIVKRLDINRIDWKDIGERTTAPVVVKKEELVEVEPEE